MSELDHIGEQILRELERDGRISNLELAERVGLSPSACLRRVASLEARGIIQGYRARVDRSKLGIGFVAYLNVGLTVHTKTAQLAFERAVAQSDAVRECHNITGSTEYLLRVECPDLKAYKTFHSDVLGVVPEVGTIVTYVVMDSPKDMRS